MAPDVVRQGGTFPLTLKMTNDGFARIHNPRMLEVVLRHRDSSKEFHINVDQNLGNRMYLPGPGETKTLEIKAAIPIGTAPGMYEIFLTRASPATHS